MKRELASVVFLIGSAACVVEASPGPPAPPPGSLILDWTIDGSKDPASCAQSSAAAIDVRVFDAGGAFAGEYKEACTAFSTTILLAPGSYTATAFLVDGAGNARTTTLDVNPFTIRGNDQLDVPLDFPVNSFV